MPVTEGQIVTVNITHEELELVRAMALAACVGGASRVRGAAERAITLEEDQLVGQLGTAALHKHWTGSLDEYRRQRWMQNQHPRQGDGGSDLVGANVDVKASLLRGTGLSLLDYRLPVRPRERHEGWIYILALVEPPNGEGRVHLIGWATDGMLPEVPCGGGPFAGAFTLRARELYPLVPVRWLW